MDDVDAISELLALQEGVQVVEQQAQVLLPGTVGHNDGRPGAGLAARRAVPAPRFHPGVPLHDLCQRRHWTKGHGHGPHCRMEWQVRDQRVTEENRTRGQGHLWPWRSWLGAQQPPMARSETHSPRVPITGMALRSLEGVGFLPSPPSYLRLHPFLLPPWAGSYSQGMARTPYHLTNQRLSTRGAN